MPELPQESRAILFPEFPRNKLNSVQKRCSTKLNNVQVFATLSAIDIRDGIMARRGDHSRDKIHCMALDAAEAIVVAEGYSGLSARKVAAAIGYTVGMLYLVFENHNDLILQVNGRTLDRLHERLVAAVVSGNAENAAETTLTTLARAYIDYATSEAPRWNMLFEYIADKNDIVPEWYQYKLGRVFGLVETALRPLAQDEAETCRIARVLWAGVHGICTLKIRQRLDLAGGQSAEEMANMLIRNFLRGLQGG